MKRSPSNGTWLGRLSIAVVGLTWLAAGCGEQPDTVEIKQGEVITWTNLTLMNNWQNYWGTSNPPAVALIKRHRDVPGRSEKSESAGQHRLRPAAGDGAPVREQQWSWRPRSATTSAERCSRCLYKDPPPGVAAGSVYVFQDGIYPNLGKRGEDLHLAGRPSLTTRTAGTVIGPPGTDWVSMYGYRQNMPNSGCTTNDCGVYVRLTSDGFIRFKGALTNLQGAATATSSWARCRVAVHPRPNVTIPVSVGGLDPAQSWSALTIYSTGASS
jgi:hypothetical protein